MSITLKEVKEVIREFNNAKLYDKILIKGKTSTDLIKGLITAIDALYETPKAMEIPEEVAEFYRNIPDEYFEEDSNGSEVSEVEESEPEVEESEPEVEESEPEVDESESEVDDDLFNDDLFNDDDDSMGEVDNEKSKSESSEENTEEIEETKDEEATQDDESETSPCVMCGEELPLEDLDDESICSSCVKREEESKKKPATKKTATKKTATKKTPPQEASSVNSSVNSSVVLGADFFQFLNRVFLAKTVEECVITIKNGYAKILSFDVTESVFTKSVIECEGDFGVMGIGNLEILLKYFKSRAKLDIAISREGNRLKMNSTGHENFSFLLSDEDVISTYTKDLEELSDINEVVHQYDYSCDLDVLAAKTVQDFIKNLKSELCSISVEKNGLVCISGGNANEHKFSVDIDEVSVNPDGDLPNIVVLAKHINKILSAINYDDDVSIFLSTGETLVIQNGQNAWGLSEIIED